MTTLSVGLLFSSSSLRHFKGSQGSCYRASNLSCDHGNCRDCDTGAVAEVSFGRVLIQRKHY
jgi:hypothetical protein